jgi:uncharacterized protein (UPF0248 family)
MAFNTLNRLKWAGKLRSCEIVIRHRGAPNDIKVISGEDVTELKRGHLNYKSGYRETTIPLHRVLEIRVGRSRAWIRKRKKG